MLFYRLVISNLIRGGSVHVPFYVVEGIVGCCDPHDSAPSRIVCVCVSRCGCVEVSLS